MYCYLQYLTRLKSVMITDIQGVYGLGIKKLPANKKPYNEIYFINIKQEIGIHSKDIRFFKCYSESFDTGCDLVLNNYIQGCPYTTPGIRHCSRAAVQFCPRAPVRSMG